MHIVLWDTHRFDVLKDYAAGFGIGSGPPLSGLKGSLIRHFYRLDQHPTTLLYAYLAAIFRRLGHSVEYAADKFPEGDFYIFQPSLMTLEYERCAMAALKKERPQAKIQVVGMVATMLPECFEGLNATVVQGEAEQLLWRWGEVSDGGEKRVSWGNVEDLNALPYPDWTPFHPERFRICYDFSRFPTASIVASRGCAFHCDYCPYALLGSTVRLRAPQAVVDEMQEGINRWNIRSYKFRDPLIGFSQEQLTEILDRMGGLSKKVQFSIETRVEWMTPGLLAKLKNAGLTSITFGAETPHRNMLEQHRRHAPEKERLKEFVRACRTLKIRTIGSFLIGFPEDTEQTIRDTYDFARQLNPTFANFNIFTPYPGTKWYSGLSQNLEETPWERFSSHDPIGEGQSLEKEKIVRLRQECFEHFYYRWSYWRENRELFLACGVI